MLSFELDFWDYATFAADTREIGRDPCAPFDMSQPRAAHDR